MANPKLTRVNTLDDYGDEHDWSCEANMCALWDNRLKACSIFSVMVALKGISRSMRRLDKTDIEESIDDYT